MHVKAPSVSVVMTVFKANATYLSQSIESVLGQTFPDFELVIVEDPSAEPAAATLARWQDQRVRFICNAQRTSYLSQRKQTLAAARADLVAVIDADDIWEPDKLERQVMHLQVHPQISVLGTNMSVINGDGRICGYRDYPLEHNSIITAMRRFNPIGHPSVVFRKNDVLEAGGYQYRGPAEDYELWCRLARRGARFGNCSQALVRYRIHDDQSKAIATRDTLLCTMAIKEMYWRDQWSWFDRLWFVLEKCLLRLPPPLVLELAKRVYYYNNPLAVWK